MTTLTPPVFQTHPVAPQHNAIASLASSPQSVSSAIEVPAYRHASALKTALADHCNQRTLAEKLKTVIQCLPEQLQPEPSLSMIKARAQMETSLASHLKNTTMYVCDDASYQPLQPLPADRLVSLEAYIQGYGMDVPKTLEALVDLKNSLTRQAQVHPLGNFGGGLSWPMAMPESDRSSIIALMQSPNSGVPGLPLADDGKGALGYLISGSSITAADLKTPIVALEKLLESPKAKALGQAIESRLGGIPSGIGASDYVLTAIHLGLDPQFNAASARNIVAGFDLGRSQHWGQPPSEVVEGLAKHLVDEGRASTQTAALAAHLLLARTAPEFLVKNVPVSVTVGSVLWAQLAMAVARIEAQTPGRTLAMGYAEILLAAETISGDDIVSQQAEYQFLRDWGVANGFLAMAQYTPSANDMEHVRTAFNSHLGALKAASIQLQTTIPDRKTMALAQLKEVFPDLDASLFEVRTLQKARLKEGRPGLYPGMRSMLDIVMEGDSLGEEDHWISNDRRIPITTFCNKCAAGRLGVPLLFQREYNAALNAHEAGQQTQVRHLISTLPLEDRKNLTEGALEFFQTHQYKIAGDLFTPPALHVRGHTLEVKTTRNGQVNLYTIDTRRSVIEKENFLIRRRTEPYTANKMEERDANILSKTAVFKPYEDERAQQSVEQTAEATQTDSFNASRSHYIADVFVKSLDLRNDDLLREARNVSSYDEQRARNDAIYQFFLNLIPLRSAIVNFQQGNVGQGIFDLALDAVGLITLGASKAAQAGKAVGKAFSSLRQVGRAVRFVGATAVEALNPLSGLGDLAIGGGRLAFNGSRYVAAKLGQHLNQLKGAAGSYDLLKAASKQHGEAATGVFKFAGEGVEGAGVLHNGKWYALDVYTMRPYGGPIEDFAPAARAVDGKITHLPTVPDGDLRNVLFREFKVPESRITGRSRNSQGVYVAADGHLSHIRHTDSTGQTGVYEVRQVTRTVDGKVQARVYHNNRQTSLVLEHVQGDKWRRLGLTGGNPPSIINDLGPIIGKGGEGIVYASLDGKRAYKELHRSDPTRPVPNMPLPEVEYLNRYYGEGFARTAYEDGRRFLVMGRIEGENLSQIQQKGGLPPRARPLLAQTLEEMEAKGIYHNDKQLKNYIYSEKDNKIYPVDLDSTPAECIPPGSYLMQSYEWAKEDLLKEYAKLFAQEP